MRRSMLSVVSLTTRMAMTMSTAVRSTTASGSGASVYETKRAVDEYLLFHYGDPNILMPYKFGPIDALDFTKRTSQLCSKFLPTESSTCISSKRCLDVGCSVGGSSFELSRTFSEVIGIDFSQHFVDAANEMKQKGEMGYDILQQGKIYSKGTAKLPEDINRSKVSFYQGDACNLNSSLGKISFSLQL